MNVVLAGLTAREATALGMLVDKALPGWQCLPSTSGPQATLPPADLYVVDLAGLGVARWSEAAQAVVLKLLGGVCAVLVAPAFDQTWLALSPHSSSAQKLVLLNKPYGVEAMRAALQQAAPRAPAPAGPTPIGPAPARPATPQRTRALQASRALLPSDVPVPVPAPVSAPAPAPVAVPAPVPAPDPVPASGTLTAHEFQALMAEQPTAPLFLRKLALLLSQQPPFEVRVSFLHRMIFHPDGQWAASNTPASALQRLCQHDDLAAGLDVDPIDSQGAQSRAARLGLSTQPLPALLWQLVHHHLVNRPV